MKKVLIVLFILLSVSVLNAAKYSSASTVCKTSEISYSYPVINPVERYAQGDKWGAFWINFIIGAIGAYSIYGFAAGVVSAGVTYFVTNGNKKAFKKAIWGSLAGITFGFLVRWLTIII